MEYLWEVLSPLGKLTLSGNGEALTGLWIENQKYFGSTLAPMPEKRCVPVFLETIEWLERYFRGENPGIPPALAPKGSVFRRQVWELLQKIPYGTVTTYGALAEELSRQNGGTAVSARAVGGAVGHNPISILIPCHRVIGKDGSLTGYAGGTEKKQYLLELEKSGAYSSGRKTL